MKIKSLIYKYFGIYLADKEELEYLQSKEFWKQFIKILSNKKNDMSPRDIQGLLIGLWQANHGFARCSSNLSWKRGLHWKVLGRIHEFFITIKWDLERLLRKLKS